MILRKKCNFINLVGSTSGLIFTDCIGALTFFGRTAFFLYKITLLKFRYTFTRWSLFFSHNLSLYFKNNTVEP